MAPRRSFPCPSCGHKVSAGAARTGKCPKCRARLPGSGGKGLLILLVLVAVGAGAWFGKDVILDKVGGGDAAEEVAKNDQPDAPPDRQPEKADDPSGTTEEPSPSKDPDTPEPTDPKAVEPEIPARITAPIQRQLATVQLGYIVGYVRAFAFDKALSDLNAFRSDARDEVVLRNINERISAVRAYSDLLDKMVASIRKGRLHDQKLALEGSRLDLRLIDADRQGFTIKITGSGTMKEKWRNLSYAERWKLLSQLRLSNDEAWTLAKLSWDLGEKKLAEQALAVAWKRAGESARDLISAKIAETRGEDLPIDGYVVHKGAFVTKEEKANIDKGLVLFRGSWVTRNERDHLRKNHVKVGGHWVPMTPKQMEARGFRKIDGRWRSPSEVRELRGSWANAWKKQSTYWLIKTNYEERFLDRAAIALDETYRACQELFKRHLGNVPPTGGTTLKINAFGDFDSYRKFCKDIGRSMHIKRTGFSSRSKRLACAYRWMEDDDVFLRSLIHNAARLYYNVKYERPPDWFSRGLSSYFEGFSIDAKGHLKFDHRPPGRLSRLLDSFNKKVTFPLGELIATDYDAMEKSDRKLVFMGQSWGFFYFLNNTKIEKYRTGFSSYVKGLCKAEQPDLLELLGGDWKPVERAFRNFIRRFSPPRSGWLGKGACIK